ncbi:hypothetical protein TNCV_3593221 [Trichonephila clavipes]|nr:hypothetical protein TNCV_3593221 [Trichonephila clavipes]
MYPIIEEKFRFHCDFTSSQVNSCTRAQFRQERQYAKLGYCKRRKGASSFIVLLEGHFTAVLPKVAGSTPAEVNRFSGCEIVDTHVT